MIRHHALTLAIVGAFAMLGTDPALARKHAAAKTQAAEPAKPAEPVGKQVEYTELEHHVGDMLVIETTLDTVRRGKLVKYTNPGLTLQLGPEHGSIELSVPRETIRNVSLVTPAAEAPAPAQPKTPAQPTTGASSAKKN